MSTNNNHPWFYSNNRKKKKKLPYLLSFSKSLLSFHLLQVEDNEKLVIRRNIIEIMTHLNLVHDNQ